MLFELGALLLVVVIIFKNLEIVYVHNSPEIHQLNDVKAALRVFFNGDEAKVQAWMRAENPLLGGLTPIYLISVGRGHKVLSFIKTAREENGW